MRGEAVYPLVPLAFAFHANVVNLKEKLMPGNCLPGDDRVQNATSSPEPAPAEVIIVVEQDKLIGPDLRWPLRIAGMRDADVTILVLAPKMVSDGLKQISLSESAEQAAYDHSVAQRVRSALDEYLGSGRWTSKRPSAPGETGVNNEGELPGRQLRVQLRLFAPRMLAGHLHDSIQQPRSDLVLFVGGTDLDSRKEWTGLIVSTLRSIVSSVAVIIPGTRHSDGKLMVAAGRGPHGQAAMELTGGLAGEMQRDLTTLYVEPDVGPDAIGVGHRILDRLLKEARQEKLPAQITKRVVLHNDVAKGVTEACHDESVELCVLGASQPGALGELRSSSVPSRVLQARLDATLMMVRAAVPLPSQLLRWLGSQARTHIPQLARDGRIALVERIQSQSHWNFDFVLLIGLSTIIATLGLLDNSAAVIIGAMLVAPLMTPLLGLGLAIAQGNPRLSRMTMKATALGFTTAFFLAFVIGLLSGEFRESTDEMLSRNWPQMLHLVVAFVSGLAAAYASGRPGLLSALPGVAIAAALLPPVATSGLALSIRDYDLALGALLLFAVNMLAIVLAAAFTLRAVGIRTAGKTSTLTRVLNRAFLVITIATALTLTIAPPHLTPKRTLVEAVEQVLADDYRLSRIRLDRQPEGLIVQMNLGGTQLPDAELKQNLLDVTRMHLGQNASMRLNFQYEAVVE